MSNTKVTLLFQKSSLTLLTHSQKMWNNHVTPILSIIHHMSKDYKFCPALPEGSSVTLCCVKKSIFHIAARSKTLILICDACFLLHNP
jgi:hypothetical protein